jgi:predicted nucleic acid-binding protein
MNVSFFDSNVPIYLLSEDRTKSARAERLLLAGGIISVQVLNEVTLVARRRLDLEWAQVRAFLADIRKLVDVQPVTLAVHERGLYLAERYNLHIYDAMIASAALEAGCDTLYSEDMHAGLRLEDRLTVVNPFA